MSGTTDKIKGRVKEAVGALTDNQGLKDEGQLDEATGKLKTVGTYNKKINAKGHATIMKYAKKLPPHTMIYRSGDDIYVLEGQALQNDTSQTLSDHAKGWIDSD